MLEKFPKNRVKTLKETLLKTYIFRLIYDKYLTKGLKNVQHLG